MYIYNTTFCLEDSALDAWKQWLDEEYVPMMTSEGSFFDLHIFRVLTENAGDSISISVQFSVGTLVAVDRWRKEQEQLLAASVNRLFGTKVLYFSTVLEVLV
jgi:Domain of unknown function (DUF4286)